MNCLKIDKLEIEYVNDGVIDTVRSRLKLFVKWSYIYRPHTICMEKMSQYFA